MPFHFVVTDSVTGETIFDEPLLTQQCNHKRCDFDATIGGPWCARHRSTLQGIVVSESKALASIGVTGLGVYAARRFAPGDFVAVYGGERVDIDELTRRYGDGSCVYSVFDNVTRKNGLYCDASLCRLAASLINDARGLQEGGAKYNVEFVQRAGCRTMEIYASEHIAKGEELLLDYGNEYWDPETLAKTHYETVFKE